ncbi:MAG: hypothetical protein JST86_09480 [Bacteroidetes bacterium]|nr:hypothetical protein [Bacteroidota bacterium]
MKKLPKMNKKTKQRKVHDSSKPLVYEDKKTYGFLQQSRARHLNLKQMLTTVFTK